MKHYSYEEWMKYVENELGEDVREVYENHLYSCDQCLDIYLEAVAEAEPELPMLSNETDFTDLVMVQIANTKSPDMQKPQVKRKQSKRFYQSAAFHYTIAAAMTILLMMTGVFQSITQYAGDVQSPEFQKKESSVTEGIVDKTFGWLDSIETKNKEEGK